VLELACGVKDQPDLRSLGKRHPEDEDKLEGVVEGCLVSKESDRPGKRGTHGTSRRR
jgi:hypothetical protein